MEYCKGCNHIFIEALKIEISNFLSKKIQIFQPGTNNPTQDSQSSDLHKSTHITLHTLHITLSKLEVETFKIKNSKTKLS